MEKAVSVMSILGIGILLWVGAALYPTATAVLAVAMMLLLIISATQK